MLIAGTVPMAAADDLAKPIAKGRDFLVGLFDPDLQLLPEYRQAKVFWLFHDNYLAAKVLAETHPQIAGAIRAAIAREKVFRSGKIEILFNQATKPFPFREFKLMDVRRAGPKLIRTEVATERPLEGWAQYADLLFLASIGARNNFDATRHWNAAMELWDGNGFRDAASRAHQNYSTYKLGLALIAGERVAPHARALEAITAKLLSLQDVSGGWITDYDARGNRLGVANVETTCLAILGLEKRRAAPLAETK
jgi:hypothetical protein